MLQLHDETLKFFICPACETKNFLVICDDPVGGTNEEVSCTCQVCNCNVDVDCPQGIPFDIGYLVLHKNSYYSVITD